MTQPLPFRANVAWSFVGNVVFAAAQWLIIIVIAKYLTLEELGVYAYLLAVTGPLIILAQSNLRILQAVTTDDDVRLSDVLMLRIVALAITVPIVAVIVGAKLGWSVALFVGLPLMLSRAVDAVADVTHGQMLRAERLDRFGRSMLLRGGAHVVGFGMGYAIEPSLIAGVVGMLLASVLVLTWHDVRVTRPLLPSSRHGPTADATRRFVWNRARVTSLLRRAAPLGVMAVLGSLYQNVPRYYVEHFIGVEAVGHFSAVFYLTLVGYTLVLAMSSAASPRLAALYQTDRSRFGHYVVMLCCIAAAVGGGGVVLALVAGASILSVLYTPAYSNLRDLLVWVMVGGMLWYMATILSYAAMAAQRLASQALLHAVTFVVTAALCTVLVPRLGVSGGAAALAIGLAVLLVGEAIVVLVAVRDTATIRATPPVRHALISS